MKLKNVLIVVNDIQRSIEFYKNLFGLDVVLDNDGNVIMTEGLVLQDASIWEKFIEKDIIPRNNATELYFEEVDIEGFAKKLESYKEPIQYVSPLMKHSWGQRVIRFYDLDGNLIEVGTPPERKIQ
ncbi:VOC family protein [Lacrimispora sp.]|uniref:VOC family protein n=1 Tax=Lacrimispora sp. TaxID=2719234 RepID=UPI003460277B